MIKAIEIFQTARLGWAVTIQTDDEDHPVQSLLFDSVGDMLAWQGKHLGEPAAIACYSPAVLHRWVEVEGREICADCGMHKAYGAKEAA